MSLVVKVLGVIFLLLVAIGIQPVLAQEVSPSSPATEDQERISSPRQKPAETRVRRPLRGYVAGQYFTRYMMATQLEYRLVLPKRFGLVLVGGVGEVIPGEGQRYGKQKFPPAAEGRAIPIK
jgi:hypothetical protein